MMPAEAVRRLSAVMRRIRDQRNPMPTHPPQEGWVVLLDGAGREVSKRVPVVVKGDPKVFAVEHAVAFRVIEAGTVVAVRVYDVDGTYHDAPLV